LITDLINTTGDDIDNLGIEGIWTTLTLPISGNMATLSVSLESNAGSEAIYVDNVIFAGTACETASETTYDEVACFACPTIGAISGPVTICGSETFDITASDILGVDMMTNLDIDYAIEFVSFPGSAAPADPYTGGTPLGTVPFTALTGPTGGPYEAMLSGLSLTAGTYQVCAILEPDPTIDPDCRPSQCTTVSINSVPAAPIVSDLEVCDGESTEIVIESIPGIVFEETFDVEGEGVAGSCSTGTCETDVPASNGQWFISGDFSGLTAGSDYLQTTGGVLESQDLDAEVCFETTTIDISGLMDVYFSVNVRDQGDHEASDYVDVSYIVDGVETLIPNWMMAGSATHTLIGDIQLGGAPNDADWINTTVTEEDINGLTFSLKVCMLNNAGSENMTIDDVMIGGTPSSYNFYDGDPATGNLLASGVSSYDPMTTVTNSPETFYVTCVNPASGCEGPVETVTVTVNPQVIVVCEATDVSCFGEADGTATATATVGLTPYTFAWSNGATTASITGLVAGTYTVTVTDAGGCSATCESVVSQPTELLAECTSVNNLCNGDALGSVTVVASGGIAPYAYAWSNGGIMATEMNLIAGTYTVTVTDANGCTSTCESIVTEPPLLVADCTGENINCNGEPTGSATVTTTGGVLPYSFAWSNGATTATITDLLAGTYSVTVTDANGCTATCETSITESELLVLECTGVDVLCNGELTGSATVVATGGTPPVSYSWSSGGTMATESNLAAGTYVVTVTDASGCEMTCSVVISEPPLLTATCTSEDNLCNGESMGSATVTAGGGIAPYTYLWSSGGTLEMESGLAAGTYTVTVTDANGCTATCESVISEPALLEVSCTATDASCNGGSDGTVGASITGGTPFYSIMWSNGSFSSSQINLPAGTYTITVTDGNGCTATCESTVGNSCSIRRNRRIYICMVKWRNT